MAEIKVVGDGIYTPVPTFFKEDYSLDLETQVKHAKSLYESGISGLVVSGSMGESIHLTRAERLTLLKTLREAIPDPKFKLIAGLPPSNIQDVTEEIALAGKNGADFAILLVSGYYGPNLTHQSGVVDYFSLIADKSELPIIIYHYPGVCNMTDITTETFDILAKHKNIVGVKMTHFNMDRFILLTGQKEANEKNNFRPFSGLGQILVPSLAIGTFGAIDGLSGVFPKSMVKLYNLYTSKQYQEAEKLQFLVTRANQMVFNLNLVGVKHALNVFRGLGNPNVSGRPPLNNKIADADWKKFEADLKTLDAYEKTL